MKRRLGALFAATYKRLYAALCGKHPYLRPWHFQWLAGRALYGPLRAVLADAGGEILDVGCQDKPYRTWTRASRYFGIDIAPGPHVDMAVRPDEPWPLDSDSFDVTICTQVLEHATDPDLMLAEMRRVTRPGGRLIVTVPFSYNEHADPHDYRRLSRHGANLLLSKEATVTHLETQGGVGTLLGTNLLNWLELTVSNSGPLAVLRFALLPLWIGLSAAVNIVGAALDWLDRTDQFYGNVLVVAQLQK